MFTVLRIILSFALVGGLLWFFARSSDGKLGSLLQRTVGGADNDTIAVVARRQLTRSSSLVVVRAGSRHVLLSVSDGDGVSMLVEGDDLVDPPPLDEEHAPEPGTALVPTTLDLELHDGHDHHDQNSVERRRWNPARTGAWTHSPSHHGQLPPRMSFIEALREQTVRRT